MKTSAFLKDCLPVGFLGVQTFSPQRRKGKRKVANTFLLLFSASFLFPLRLCGKYFLGNAVRLA
jgi:hypothetical protein